MGHKKLIRFEAIKGFSNVLQYPEGIAGNWKGHFGNDNPLVLELACGKGEYTVGLAAMHPGKNFIGVDLKGNRLYVGAKKCLEQSLSNAAFLRIQIDKLDEFFAANEVSDIWITFPDPQLRISREKKRLTHPRFLRMYQKVLRPGGRIHLKTDSPVLYRFTLLVLEQLGIKSDQAIDDVYAQPEVWPELAIKTHYEGLDIAGSNRVHYIRFQLPESPLPNIDKDLHELVKEKEMHAD